MGINEFTLDIILSNYIKLKTPEKIVLEVRGMSSKTLIEMLETLPQYMKRKSAIIIGSYKKGSADCPTEAGISYHYKGGTLELRSEQSHFGEEMHDVEVTITHPCVPRQRAENFVVLFLGKYIKQK